MAERYDPFAGADWDSNDSQALRNFLTTVTGRRLVFRLRNDRPSITPPPASTVSPIEGTAMSGAKAAGYEEAVNNLFLYLVTEPVQDSKVENFPDLDNDALWPETLQRTPIIPPTAETQ